MLFILKNASPTTCSVQKESNSILHYISFIAHCVSENNADVSHHVALLQKDSYLNLVALYEWLMKKACVKKNQTTF